MGYLPAFTHPERGESPSSRYYQELLDQAAAARRGGDHLRAQQLASAAHKWAMDEIIRLQRVSQAEAELAQANKQLESAWDRDRACATLEELGERHPEFRRLITRRDTAEERLAVLAAVIPADAPAEASGTRAWRGPRPSQS
ncbi:MAG TPA: hypothetical protein VFI42_02075 [Thermomicrobiaceae bacterium]|nr:hypothetical protein [Thermomicrobiaceae bacterium]